jgi:hypothetical protein
VTYVQQFRYAAPAVIPSVMVPENDDDFLSSDVFIRQTVHGAASPR